MFWQDMSIARSVYSLKKGDNVVLTGGQINGAPGNTNTIKVESAYSTLSSLYRITTSSPSASSRSH